MTATILGARLTHPGRNGDELDSLIGRSYESKTFALFAAIDYLTDLDGGWLRPAGLEMEVESGGAIETITY